MKRGREKNNPENWFDSSTDVNSVVEEIMKKEPLVTATKVEKVKELIESNALMEIDFGVLLEVL